MFFHTAPLIYANITRLATSPWLVGSPNRMLIDLTLQHQGLSRDRTERFVRLAPQL